MDRLKLAAFGERLKTGGAEMGRKVSDKMKGILQGQSLEAKMVDEATSETLEESNWGLNLRICGLLNGDEFNGSEVVRALKRKIAGKNAVSQKLSLDLLEICAMNCDKVFSEIASEKLLDDMVKMIDNPQTLKSNRHAAMQLIEAWGNSNDLAYLPIFNQTYMALKEKAGEVPSQHNGHSAPETSLSELMAAIPQGYPRTEMDPRVSDPDLSVYRGGPDGSLSIEEKREVLVTARNSAEILSSILNPEVQNSMNDELTLSMVEKCREAQLVVQSIVEDDAGDESLLFEALNLHDELRLVLSKYDALLVLPDPAPNEVPTSSAGKTESVSPELVVEQLGTQPAGGLAGNGESLETKDSKRDMERE